MKSKKRYTTQTFTRRVDHEGGAHRMPETLLGLAHCSKCGAIHIDGRWTIDQSKLERKNEEPYPPTICPACKQIESGVVGGYFSMSGDFVREHRDEIEGLINNEAACALEDNPLSRIMNRRDADDEIVVETTTEHLAQRLGHSVKKAYAGEISYDFSHENKLARVNWHRD